MKSELVGYVKKSNNGNALKLKILKSALEDAETVKGIDGTEYISLIMNLSKIKMIISDEHEITSLCQLTEEENDPPKEDDRVRPYSVTSICKDDLYSMLENQYDKDTTEYKSRATVVDQLDGAMMKYIANELSDDYCEQLFWQSLQIIFENRFEKEIREKESELVEGE